MPLSKDVNALLTGLQNMYTMIGGDGIAKGEKMDNNLTGILKELKEEVVEGYCGPIAKKYRPIIVDFLNEYGLDQTLSAIRRGPYGAGDSNDNGKMAEGLPNFKIKVKLLPLQKEFSQLVSVIQAEQSSKRKAIFKGRHDVNDLSKLPKFFHISKEDRDILERIGYDKRIENMIENIDQSFANVDKHLEKLPDCYGENFEYQLKEELMPLNETKIRNNGLFDNNLPRKGDVVSIDPQRNFFGNTVNLTKLVSEVYYCINLEDKVSAKGLRDSNNHSGLSPQEYVRYMKMQSRIQKYLNPNYVWVDSVNGRDLGLNEIIEHEPEDSAKESKFETWEEHAGRVFLQSSEFSDGHFLCVFDKKRYFSKLCRFFSDSDKKWVLHSMSNNKLREVFPFLVEMLEEHYKKVAPIMTDVRGERINAEHNPIDVSWLQMASKRIEKGKDAMASEIGQEVNYNEWGY
ncbi:MAG: hypothetical protein LBH47_02105 [Christensenellaceae bacterium]|jgi:hypothetical protein|nr:hypothetical protein [Christensenellaceae bacterium]